ncbi:UPF0725 protein [Frankliniella fusca]|uniref:UPF0725 protein n=1 Tax=Frankliniella fusca TaxID=407009 RepID=A0AAE1LPD0_9NEOP|nr:UPF0725 protein [Frankliniella fusca]
MGKVITDSDRVCKDHFQDSHFFPQASPAPGKKKILKKNVVPSRKIPVRTHDKVEKSPQKRARESRKRRANARAEARSSLENRDAESNSDVDISNEIPDSNNNMDRADLGPPAEPPHENAPPPIQFIEMGSQTPKLSLLILLKDASMLYTFTGIPSFELLEVITECALEVPPDTAKMILPMKLRILLTFTKLKLNLSYTALSVLFDITDKTCRNYFKDTILILAKVLKDIIYLPSKEETLQNMPKCFRKYWRTRSVLDCAEIPVEKPKCLKERILYYSHYKGRLTVKFCVGVSPGGMLTFISKCFGGRASDKKIVVHSGILDQLEFNDGVMVDKGFMIEEECLVRNLFLYRPPFLSKKKTLSKAEALNTAEIAGARVHVERAIKNLRDFDILVDQISLNLLPFINDILVVCGALVNLSAPVLAMDKF